MPKLEIKKIYGFNNIYYIEFFLVTAFISAAYFTEPAYGIQTHKAPEGLYIHQIGHILFGASMAGFMWRIKRSRLYSNKAWKYMAKGAFLLAVWNVWAFSGHVIEEIIPASQFITESHGMKSALIKQSYFEFLYCILKMDHLVCVPAIIFIYLALRELASSMFFNENSIR